MMNTTPQHPMAEYMRTERMPHIWCPGCGIGTALNSFLHAVQAIGDSPDNYLVVSGIGCTGRVAGYVNMDSFHTTHGRALPVATGLKLIRPDMKVVVISGDGDLTAIGGNHFIHAARRNLDVTVFCINNFNYGMTGGQAAPTTPCTARTATTPQGNTDPPFNLPMLAAAAGATYIARWTVFHIRQLQKAMAEAIGKPGFSFIEVISPCPTLFGRRNKVKEGVDHLKAYRENAVIKKEPALSEAAIEMNGPIVCGKFVDIDKPSLLDRMSASAA
ncbi:2-oxoacid:ferredoxin oxidoreductase subunit beta [bacterium]|nr:2-oxoacid:ferredoxin oxidoreductase subunit beta [bacterium]